MADRNKQRQPITIDQGPAERRQHNKVALELDANHRARLRILDQHEIDRLLLEHKITIDQHTAGEHLFNAVQQAGYLPSCKWALDSNIRGAAQNISQGRADTLLKLGLARAWLLAKSGRRTTEYLFGVVLGERKVDDPYVPSIRLGLSTYQSFEGWWHGRDTDVPLPALLADLPSDVLRSSLFGLLEQHTRPFLNQKG